MTKTCQTMGRKRSRITNFQRFYYMVTKNTKVIQLYYTVDRHRVLLSKSLSIYKVIHFFLLYYYSSSFFRPLDTGPNNICALGKDETLKTTAI